MNQAVSAAFESLANSWELDEAQSLHAAAEKQFEAAINAEDTACSQCGGTCEHHLLAQAIQEGRRALDDYTTGRDEMAAKRAAHLWGQIEAPGQMVCLACYGGVK